MKLCFIGFGAWGGALGIFLARHGIGKIYAWEYLDSIRTAIQKQGIHPHLGEASRPFPQTIKIVNTLDELPLAKNLLIVATGSQFFLSTIRQIPWSKNGLPEAALILTKGLEPKNGEMLSQVLQQNSPISKKNIFVLSGPTIAKELLAGAPTAAIVAGKDPVKLKKIQKILNRANFHTQTSRDLTGTQVGGSMKNIYAIGYGILDGLQAPANAKALYLTRSLEEMSQTAKHLKGQTETVYGVAGLGDLLTTSLSLNSRNSKLGRFLAQGRDLSSIQKEIGMVTEGVEACRIYLNCARHLKVKLPLARTIADILKGTTQAQKLVVGLQ